jgi:hypothetical protein
MALVTSTPIPPAIAPRAALVALGQAALAATALAGVYRVTGLGLPCPSRLLTGWLCPFCGGTRAGAALLSGDVAAAWAFNPLLLVAAVLVGVRAIGWLIELAHGRPTARRWLPYAVTRHWMWIALVVGGAFMVARNLT